MTTFVLIHGSYQGGWIWRFVAEQLRTQGHLVFTPTLEGCAERSGGLRPGITTETMGAEISQLLYYYDLTDVVLVGTSSGGMVMASAAEHSRERVARLVFADALALQPGERVVDLVSTQASVVTDLALGPNREDMEGRMFRDLDPELRQWTADRCTLHPKALHTETVILDHFWQQDWEASVIYCQQAPNPGKAHQQRCAEILKARWHEIDTGHYPMLSTPGQLADLIVNG